MASYASRYARALAEVILESHLNPAEIQQQLSDFEAAWRESRDLREFLTDPSFPVDQKVQFLDKLNQRLGMAPQTRNFLAVLIRNGRIAGLEQVLRDFREEMNRQLGIVEATVISARPLDGPERRDIEERIAAMTGSRVAAEYREDKSLIGGVIVQVGSTVYDGSVRGRLDRLREELVAS